MQTNNERRSDDSIANILPKLTNDEYQTLLSCLAYRQFGKCCGLLTSQTINELISKIQDKTIETNTYTRMEGC